MRTLVIINPAAGGGLAAETVAGRIGSRLKADIRVTEAPGHAASLASAAASSGFDRVVAAGGDGTVGEVASGLYGPQFPGAEELTGGRPEMGIVPLGTGNDLARSLDIPLDVEAATEVVRRGRAVPLDLIEATGGKGGGMRRIVANATVAGFCGRIGDRMSAGFRRRWGRLAYPVAALREIGELRSHVVRAQADGRSIETPAFMVIVANGRFAGGRIPLAPSARTDDGKLDLVIIEARGLVRLAPLVPWVMRGHHVGRPGVRCLQAARLELASDPPMWMNVDGETWCAGAASFQVLPAALRVIAP